MPTLFVHGGQDDFAGVGCVSACITFNSVFAQTEDAIAAEMNVALSAVDATGELADDARAALRTAVEALPGASVGRRAFFGTWDSETPDAEGSLAAKARGKLSD